MAGNVTIALTAKQEAWAAEKQAAREAKVVEPVRSQIVHAPKGSPLRVARRANRRARAIASSRGLA